MIIENVKELTDPSKKMYYQTLMKTKYDVEDVTEMSDLVDQVINSGSDIEGKQKDIICEWFDTEEISKERWRGMTEQRFADKMMSLFEEHTESDPFKKLYRAIEERLREDDEDEDEEKMNVDAPSVLSADQSQSNLSKGTDDEYQGYRDFVVWCEEWRYLLHSLSALVSLSKSPRCFMLRHDASS